MVANDPAADRLLLHGRRKGSATEAGSLHKTSKTSFGLYDIGSTLVANQNNDIVILKDPRFAEPRSRFNWPRPVASPNRWPPRSRAMGPPNEDPRCRCWTASLAALGGPGCQRGQASTRQASPRLVCSRIILCWESRTILEDCQWGTVFSPHRELALLVAGAWPPRACLRVARVPSSGVGAGCKNRRLNNIMPSSTRQAGAALLRDLLAPLSLSLSLVSSL